jgi:hypothetical protein
MKSIESGKCVSDCECVSEQSKNGICPCSAIYVCASKRDKEENIDCTCGNPV